MEIINAKTITEEMEQHYGTTDPIEVCVCLLRPELARCSDALLVVVSCYHRNILDR
jgi:hypothetical protein